METGFALIKGTCHVKGLYDHYSFVFSYFWFFLGAGMSILQGVLPAIGVAKVGACCATFCSNESKLNIVRYNRMVIKRVQT